MADGVPALIRAICHQNLIGLCEMLQILEVNERMLSTYSAHFLSGAQAITHVGALWLTEDRAQIIVGELGAADSGGLAVRHAGDG